MIYRTLTAVCVAVLFTAGWGLAANAKGFGNGPIKDVYVFGDSLSDNGNIYVASGGALPPSPPYYQGRFSNGPVWVETLAAMLGARLNDFAVGGAFTGMGNVNGPFNGISDQLADFEDMGGKVKRNDLSVVWGGANNYVFYGGSTSDPAAVVQELEEIIEGLADLGGRRFLVPNLPDLGQTPLALAQPIQVQLFLSNLSNLHNVALDEALAELREDLEVEIVLLDTQEFFDQVINDPEAFGLETVDEACLVLPPSFSLCADPDAYLFWDALHPTAVAHDEIAALAFDLLSAAVSASQIAAAE